MQGKSGMPPIHTILPTYPPPPCFSQKSPQSVENKGRALQKARKSSQIADNKKVELRTWLLVTGGKPLCTEGKWTG